MNERAEATWIARSREETMFASLYHRHYRAIREFCRRRVPKDVVDDVVAETFLTAWRRIDDIPRGDEGLLWLYGVAYRVIAAEQVATEFLQTFAAFDAEAAGAYLATGASTEHVINQDVADYRQAIALFQAWGYEQELGPCRQVGATATGLQVRCSFAYHLLGSRELGVGPFDQNYFTVTVDDAGGMITEVNSSWRDADFLREVGDPFAAWVTSTHPDELELMTADGSPALTPESLALWEELRSEYVQYVLGTTPTTTAA